MKLRKVGAIRRRARGALRLGETDNEVLVLLVAAGGDAGVRLCERYSARAHELGHPFRVCAEDDIMPGTISVITLREPRPLSGEQRLAAGIRAMPHLRVGNAKYDTKIEGAHVDEERVLESAFNLARRVFDALMLTGDELAAFEREWAEFAAMGEQAS